MGKGTELDFFNNASCQDFASSSLSGTCSVASSRLFNQLESVKSLALGSLASSFSWRSSISISNLRRRMVNFF